MKPIAEIKNEIFQLRAFDSAQAPVSVY